VGGPEPVVEEVVVSPAQPLTTSGPAKAGPLLRDKVLRAGSWSLAGYGTSMVVRLGSNLIMTRLLEPSMFGVMAIATIVTMILSLLSDIGLNQSIVQSKRGDDPAFLNTAWTIQIMRGCALWAAALAICAALYVAGHAGLLRGDSVYATPILPAVIAASSFSAVLLGLQSTKMAFANRHFEQSRLVKIDICSQLCSVLVMVALGRLTHSIWALVSGGLTSSLVSALLSHLWLAGPANRPQWEKAALRELFGFGKWVFVSSSVFVLAVNGDRLILGSLVSAGVLGLYAIAALIVGTVEGALNKLYMSVSLPALAETARDNPANLRQVHYRLRVPADLALLFISGALCGGGRWIVHLLYDARYAEAGVILQILSLSLIAVRYGITSSIFLAQGEPRYLALFNTVRFVSLYTLVPLLYHLGGLHAAVWGIALHNFVVIPFMLYFAAQRGLVDVRNELKVLVAFPAGFLCTALVGLLPWTGAAS
jgi:O-antigen/teichoic acid export membrane protein